MISPLWPVNPEHPPLLFVIAYHIGLRRGALLRIKWSQIDRAEGCIWMEGKRANRKPEPVAVPIYGDMAKFLDLQPKNGEFVFTRGARIKDFRESWDQACARAEVPDLLFNDLRRTAVRNLRRAGVPESVIMKTTGHRTRTVFERYNIADQTDTQQAGRLAEVSRARARDVGTNYVTKGGKAKLMTFRKLLILKWCGEGDLNPHEIAPPSTTS